MKNQKIIKVTPVGTLKSYDLEVDHPDHNFLANGIVTSNSHAVAYASLAALGVYLKFKYPKEFFLEALEIAQNKAKPQEEIGPIRHELQHFGIKLLPPDIAKSQMHFTIEGKNIRYGLTGIKKIQEIGALKDFISEGVTNKFEVFEASKRVKLGIGRLSALIQAGALASMGDNRPLLVLEAQLWGLLTDRERVWALEHGKEYGYKLHDMVVNILEWETDGKKVARKTRLNTIKKNHARYKEIYTLNKNFPEFANWWYETELLGYSYSTDLYKVFKGRYGKLKPLSSFEKREENKWIGAIGRIIDDPIKSKSKAKGTPYFKFVFEDETAAVTAIMFSSHLEKYIDSGNPLPKKGAIVYAEGRKWNDIISVQRIALQTDKIYMQLSELKDKK